MPQAAVPLRPRRRALTGAPLRRAPLGSGPVPPLPAALYRGRAARVCRFKGKGRSSRPGWFWCVPAGKERVPAVSFVYRAATPFFSRLSSPSV